jgi:hypothetical protein
MKLADMSSAIASALSVFPPHRATINGTAGNTSNPRANIQIDAVPHSTSLPTVRSEFTTRYCFVYGSSSTYPKMSNGMGTHPNLRPHKFHAKIRV